MLSLIRVAVVIVSPTAIEHWLRHHWVSSVNHILDLTPSEHQCGLVSQSKHWYSPFNNKIINNNISIITIQGAVMEEGSRKHTYIIAYFWLHQWPMKERPGLLVTFYQFVSDNIRQLHMPTQISCKNTDLHNDSKDITLRIKVNQKTHPWQDLTVGF